MRTSGCIIRVYFKQRKTSTKLLLIYLKHPSISEITLFLQLESSKVVFWAFILYACVNEHTSCAFEMTLYSYKRPRAQNAVQV